MEEYYTVNQVAIVLKVHSLTVRRYIKEGKLRAYKAGGNIRVAVNDLRSFVETFVPGIKITNTTFAEKQPFSKEDPFLHLKAKGLSLSKGYSTND